MVERKRKRPEDKLQKNGKYLLHFFVRKSCRHAAYFKINSDDSAETELELKKRRRRCDATFCIIDENELDRERRNFPENCPQNFGVELRIIFMYFPCRRDKM